MRSKESNSILVSVIVPTFNRSRLLRELLESLADQTLNPANYEVIVADNCSTDDTAAMVAELQQLVAFPLVYLRMPWNRGPVISRNAAARLARGSILAFTDSDCRATRNWLERGVAAVGRTSEPAFASGPVRDKPEQSAGLFTLAYRSEGGEDLTYRTCNIFYRKDIFELLSGFDESAYLGQTSFMHYECADIDLAWRAKEQGYANVFDDTLVVYHEVWKVTPWNWLHKQTQLMPLPFFLKRHPHLAKSFLWHGGPLVAPQNALFYMLVAGLLLAPFTVGISLLLVAPFLIWLISRAAGEFRNKPLRTVVAVAFWGLAQAVMCGSLVWGSIRARRIVL